MKFSELQRTGTFKAANPVMRAAYRKYWDRKIELPEFESDHYLCGVMPGPAEAPETCLLIVSPVNPRDNPVMAEATAFIVCECCLRKIHFDETPPDENQDQKKDSP